MKKKFLTTAAIVTSLTLSAKELLPADIIAHVQTKDLSTSIREIESYTQTVLQGTPLALQFQPGMLPLLIPMATGLPAGTIDMGRPVHLLVANPTDQQEDIVATLLPVNNFNDSIAKTVGKQKQANGCFKLSNNFFVSPENGGYIAFGEDLFSVEKMGKLLKTWKPTPCKECKTISAIVDIEKILRLNKDIILETQKELAQDLEETSKSGDPSLEGIDKMIDSLYSEGFNLLKQAKGMRLNLDFTKENVSLQGVLTPKFDTELAAIAKLYSTDKSSFKLTNKLPENSPLTVSMNYNPALADIITPMIMRFAKPLSQFSMTKGTADTLEKSIKSYALLDGETAATMEFGGESFVKMTAYSSVIDAPKYLKEYKEQMLFSMKQVNEQYKLQNLPIEAKYSYKENAGKVNGISYDVVTMKYQETGEGLTPEQKLTTSIPEIKFALCSPDSKTIVAVMGNDHQMRLKSAIEKLNSKDLKKRKTTATLESIPNSQLAAGIVYPVSLIKDIVQLQFDIASSSSPEIKAMFAPMQNMLKAVPDSKQPVSFSYGVSDNSLCSEVHIPGKAIQEMIMTAMNLYMQQMPIQQHNPPIKSVPQKK